MLEALLVLAVLCACLSAFRRGEDGCVAFNVAALALLASTALNSVLISEAVAFDVLLWLAMDFAVIAAIGVCAFVRRCLQANEMAIIALFAPSWYFYFNPGPLGPDVSTLAVSAQLLLTFPAASAWRRFRLGCAQLPDEWHDEFDLRAVHGR